MLDVVHLLGQCPTVPLIKETQTGAQVKVNSTALWWYSDNDVTWKHAPSV